jgi:hypothetical protein
LPHGAAPLVGARRHEGTRLAVRDADAGRLDVVAPTVIEMAEAGVGAMVSAEPDSAAPAPSEAAPAHVPEQAVSATEPPGSQPVARDVTDPRELRAMTHPVRLALMEALSLHDALTATEAGELIGESPTTCSFHLRQLAKYGFVEEAGTAPGRRRPWKLSVRQLHFSSASGDPEMGAASVALENLLMHRWFERFSQWQVARSHYPIEWREAAAALETLVHVSPAELVEVQQEIFAILNRFRDRATEPSLRPEDSRPIEFVCFGFPFLGVQQ